MLSRILFSPTECVFLYKPPGHYWIDPNGGIPHDSLEVFCDFGTNATCIYPSKMNEVMTVPMMMMMAYHGELGWRNGDGDADGVDQIPC